MVSRAPILHTYALTSLNYWKWDHPQLSCVPLPCREGRLHGGIAPATKASSGRPCPSLSCRSPGRRTLGGLILERFAGQLAGLARGSAGVSAFLEPGAEVRAVPALRLERLGQLSHSDLYGVAPLPFHFDLSVCYNSPGEKQVLVWSTDSIQRAWVTSKDW